MSKYLGAQVLGIDRREPAFDYVGVQTKPLPEELPNSLLEANELRVRVLFELVKEFVKALPRIRSDFPHDELDAYLKYHGREDPLGSILFFLEDYLTTAAQAVNDIVIERPEMDLPLYLADFAMDIKQSLSPDNSPDILEHFIGELVTGAKVWAQFVELISRVFNREFEREIDAETYVKIIKSKAFTQVAMSLGMAGADAEQALIKNIATYIPEHGRSRLDEARFKFIERGGQLILVLRPEVLEKVRADFLGSSLGLKGTCPGSHVHIEGHPKQTALKEFAEWLNELLIQHYVPLVSAA